MLLQEANLCDFETWKEWKDKGPDTVKLKMRLEMETSKKKGGQRHIDNAVEIGEAILKSGLLHESTRQHLHQALKKHQEKHDKQMRHRQAQIFQVRSRAFATAINSDLGTINYCHDMCAQNFAFILNPYCDDAIAIVNCQTACYFLILSHCL